MNQHQKRHTALPATSTPSISGRLAVGLPSGSQPTWQCQNCDTFTLNSQTTCMVCGSSQRVSASTPADSDTLPVDVLPDVPDAFFEGDGYEWGSSIEPIWRVVPRWGIEGWALGNHPYTVVAHYDSPFGTSFGLATYTEGDVAVEAYATPESRDAATAELALHLWAAEEDGPADAPPPGTPASNIPPELRHSGC